MQQANKRDFDAVAGNWDQEPRRVKLAQDIVSAMRRELPLDAAMEVLDYGCGSGLVTLGLQPLVGKITGADSSKGMLEVLQRKLDEGKLENVTVQLLDLESGTLEASYDLITSAMTLHHVQDVSALIASLAGALKPGGLLALADLETEDGSFHSDSTGVLHHGFSRDFLAGEFSKNGLREVRVVTAAVIEKKGEDGAAHPYPVLLCLGRK
uniref:Methyltransferase type 11 n=1 Tax=Geobacter sp. (strain M21) TaxID=443144 RepID=C6E106_GEOSM